MAEGNKFSVLNFTFTDLLGRSFEGDFHFALVLSQAQESAAGRARRAILGGIVETQGVQEDLDTLDVFYARVQAEVTHRAVGELPESWKRAGGADWPREALLDLWKAVVEREKEEADRLRKKRDEARGELRADRDRRREEAK